MTLKEVIESKVEEFEKLGPEHWRGYDWCELSPEEESVFQIDPKRFPRMVVAVELYRALKDEVEPSALGFDVGMIKEERKRWPRLKVYPEPASEQAFTDVAHGLVGLTLRECHAIWWKMDFWDERDGQARYRDED